MVDKIVEPRWDSPTLPRCLFPPVQQAYLLDIGLWFVDELDAIIMLCLTGTIELSFNHFLVTVALLAHCPFAEKALFSDWILQIDLA